MLNYSQCFVEEFFVFDYCDVKRTQFSSVEILNRVQRLERLEHAIHALSGRWIALVALQSLR